MSSAHHVKAFALLYVVPLVKSQVIELSLTVFAYYFSHFKHGLLGCSTSQVLILLLKGYTLGLTLESKS